MKNKPTGMLYQAEGHSYYLVPEYVVNWSSIRIEGAGILNRAGEYLGYWDHWNMPLAVVHELVQWVKENRDTDVAERRNALAKRRQKQF